MEDQRPFISVTFEIDSDTTPTMAIHMSNHAREKKNWPLVLGYLPLYMSSGVYGRKFSKFTGAFVVLYILSAMSTIFTKSH